VIFDGKGSFFWSFKGCVFGLHVIFIWSLWLWSKGSFFMGFLMKREDFYLVSWFNFLFIYDFCHFKSVFFLNDWWVGGLVGFSWIVC